MHKFIALYMHFRDQNYNSNDLVMLCALRLSSVEVSWFSFQHIHILEIVLLSWNSYNLSSLIWCHINIFNPTTKNGESKSSTRPSLARPSNTLVLPASSVQPAVLLTLLLLLPEACRCLAPSIVVLKPAA